MKAEDPPQMTKSKSKAAATKQEGALKVPVRGATWLLGRMGISLALALINFLRAVLKLTIVPEGSIYRRKAAEIGVNFLRALVTRPLVAYSLYYQWEHP